MAYQIIEIADGLTVSGEVGDYICLELPQAIRDEAASGTRMYVPRMLRWLNTIKGRGLELRCMDPMGNCFFQIVEVSRHG